MTAPRTQPETADLPPLHRLLTPEEFHQLLLTPPSAVKPGTLPLFPPPAPRDATRLQPDANPRAQRIDPNSVGGQVLKHVVGPMLNNPLTTAASVAPPVAIGMMGGMAKDLGRYALQRAREHGMSPEQQAAAAQDPNHISGEDAAWNAGLLLAPLLVHAGVKAVRGEALPTGGDPSAGELVGARSAGSGERTPLDLQLADQATAEREAGRAAVRGDREASRAAARTELAQTRAAVQGHVAAVTDAWRMVVNPAARGPQAAEAAGILRATTGAMAQRYEQAAAKLDEFRRIVDPLSDEEKLGFIDGIETGAWRQPESYENALKALDQPLDDFAKHGRVPYDLHPELDPAMAPLADAIRETLDAHRTAIQNLGTGKLEHFIQDYFPHIWKDPDQATDVFAQVFGKRPMEGSRNFLKERTLPTTKDGIAMGLEPVTTNPIDLTLLKLREMQRYLMAHESLGELKNAGLVKYVPAGDIAPDGYGKINDKVATVFGPRTGAVSLPDGALKPLADDPIPVKQRELDRNAAERAAFPMGAQQLLDHAEVKGNGLTPEGIERSAKTLRKAGYGITDDMVREAKAKASRAAAGGGVIDYTQDGTDFRAKFGETFDDQRKAALGMTDLQPDDVAVHGMRIMGEHWAPEPVTRVVNNYLSPGLRGNALFDAYRGIGNTLNQAQLGLSAFHLGFTSMDATVSRTALGLEYLLNSKQLDVRAKMTGFGKLISAPLAPVTNALLGAKIRAAYLHPETATPDMLALATAVKEAGGRVRMDSFYQNSAPERMIAAWKEGSYAKATALSLPSLFEFAAKPIMEHIVPMQKLGIFGDLARKALADLPDGAPLAMRRQALGSAWDSVDNRMGQVVYDNLFWNKTFKDLAMASVRSVGWNLGTIRELGGGAFDLASQGAKLAKGEDAVLTHRAAYAIALPITVGLYGALYQYLRTGKGPGELKDYFYPQTGEVDADGNPERVQLPSYMKDVFAYAGHPWDTIKHKEAPLLAAVGEMLNNEDYFGDEIRNPQDPAVQQLLQEAKFVGGEFAPFSLTNMLESKRRGDQSGLTRFGNWFGVTPAKREDVRSAADNKIATYQAQRRTVGATPEDTEARQARADILARLRAAGQGKDAEGLSRAIDDAVTNQQLTPPQLARLMKRAGMTPAAEKFQRLTLPQMLDVVASAKGAEKTRFLTLLAARMDKATR